MLSGEEYGSLLRFGLDVAAIGPCDEDCESNDERDPETVEADVDLPDAELSVSESKL
jgi:hypothetical protein